MVRRPVNNNRHVEAGATAGTSQSCDAEQHHQQQWHHQQELRARSWKQHNIKGQGQQPKLIHILTYRSIVQWLALLIVFTSISSLILDSIIISHQGAGARSTNAMLFWTAFPSCRIRIMYPKSILFSSTGHDRGGDLAPKLPFFRRIGYPDFGGLHIMQFKLHMTRHAVDVRRRHDRNLHPQYHRHEVNGPRYHQHLHDHDHNHETPTATTPNDNEPAPRREILPDPQASQTDPSVTAAETDGFFDRDRRRLLPPRDENNENINEDCRPVSWDLTVYPTCNSFHEFDFLAQALEGHAKYVGYVY